MPELPNGGWRLDDSETGFGLYEPIAEFIDYVVFENGKPMGLRDDAPESAKEAYERYMKQAL